MRSVRTTSDQLFRIACWRLPGLGPGAPHRVASQVDATLFRVSEPVFGSPSVCSVAYPRHDLHLAKRPSNADVAMSGRFMAADWRCRLAIAGGWNEVGLVMSGDPSEKHKNRSGGSPPSTADLLRLLAADPLGDRRRAPPGSPSAVPTLPDTEPSQRPLPRLPSGSDTPHDASDPDASLGLQLHVDPLRHTAHPSGLTQVSHQSN